jgi:hypothetical protein
MSENPTSITHIDWQGLAYQGRHRADPHPDWVSDDRTRDRLGAHHNAEEPFAREDAVPAAELITGEAGRALLNRLDGTS